MKRAEEKCGVECKWLGMLWNNFAGERRGGEFVHVGRWRLRHLRFHHGKSVRFKLSADPLACGSHALAIVIRRER
jgi:hypothetical protein